MDLFIPVLGAVFAILFGVGYTHDTHKWLWNPRRKWGPQHKDLQKAKAAVEDMVAWKAQRRIEERQKWATEFEQLSPPEPQQEVAPRGPYTTDAANVHARIEAARARVANAERIINYAGETITIFPSGRPLVVPPTAVPRPNPPRGGSGVSRPREAIMVGTDMAYPVRMGKYVGHYVIRHEDYDSLLDTDKWTVLEAYEDGHYSTCPYECDCPKWARRY